MSDHSLLVHLHLPGAAALVPALLRVEGGHVAVATLGQLDLEARQVPGPADAGHVLVLVLSPAAGQRHEAVAAEAEGDAADPYALGLSTFPLLRHSMLSAGLAEVHHACYTLPAVLTNPPPLPCVRLGKWRHRRGWHALSISALVVDGVWRTVVTI